MAYFIIVLTILSLFFYLYRFTKTDNILLILPMYYNAVVLYTIFGVAVFEYAKEAPFNLYYQISNDDLYNASFMFILSSFCFYIGSALVRKNKVHKSNFHVNHFDIKKQKSLLFIILSVYVLYIVGYGAEALLFRVGYIDTAIESNKTILIIFFVASPFVTVLIPFIKNVALKYLIYFICFLILFSASSRFIIMLPFLYIIGTFLKSNKIEFKVVFINICLIMTSLIFVLQIRNYTFHGLIPNLTALFTKGIDTEYLFTGLNYALSFSLFGASYVLKNFTHDNVAFLMSLNPLPSRFININYMLESQRMLGTSPMSAVSILSLSGYATLASCYLITGYCFSFIHKKMKGKTFLYYAEVGLFILFTLFSIQYNLRGLSRIFYYSLIIFIIHLLLKNVKIKGSHTV